MPCCAYSPTCKPASGHGASVAHGGWREPLTGGEETGVRTRPEDGRAVEPLVLGHPRPRSDPSVGASQACYINVLKVNPVAIEEPFTISPGSHLAFRLH